MLLSLMIITAHLEWNWLILKKAEGQDRVLQLRHHKGKTPQPSSKYPRWPWRTSAKTQVFQSELSKKQQARRLNQSLLYLKPDMDVYDEPKAIPTLMSKLWQTTSKEFWTRPSLSRPRSPLWEVPILRAVRTSLTCPFRSEQSDELTLHPSSTDIRYRQRCASDTVTDRKHSLHLLPTLDSTSDDSSQHSSVDGSVCISDLVISNGCLFESCEEGGEAAGMDFCPADPLQGQKSTSLTDITLEDAEARSRRGSLPGFSPGIVNLKVYVNVKSGAIPFYLFYMSVFSQSTNIIINQDIIILVRN